MTTAQPVHTDEGHVRGARPQLPLLRAVLIEQLRTTGLVLRTPALVAAALGVLVTVVVAFQIVSRHLVINLHAEPLSLPGVVGALLPIAVWARDDRFGPSFLWTLPVDRRQHALVKVFAGWLWLMGGVTLYALCELVLVLLSGSHVLPMETLHVLHSSIPFSSTLDPSVLQLVQWAPGPLIWAVPFTGATATYLIASALMLGTRHPLRWVIGAVLLVPIAAIASELATALVGAGWPAHAPNRVISLVNEGRYGLDALLTVRTMSLDHREMLTTGEVVEVWSAVPSLADWGVTVVLWTSTGMLALWAAAFRHREQRPS